MTLPTSPTTTSEVPVEDLDELGEIITTTTFSITSYGADYPVDGLIKRIDTGDIVVPLFNADPVQGQTMVGFQREFVWKKSQADRFVESLLLGLPVPGIFLVKEPNGKLLVLDGHQRLSTLHSFYSGLLGGVEFRLEDVQPPWAGLTYKTLAPDDRRRLDNSIIHATIVRQDEPSEDQSSIYLIFERLNSGGTILQPQEIRVALYHGELASLLSRLNEYPDWRFLYGRKNARLKDIELILRFLALFYYEQTYKRPMKQFLNRYMATNQHLEKQSEIEITKLFSETTAAIRRGIGERAFRPRGAVNAAVLDSVLVGVASRLTKGPLPDPLSLRPAYENLLRSSRYSDAITRSTADEDSVRTRLTLARDAFAAT